VAIFAIFFQEIFSVERRFICVEKFFATKFLNGKNGKKLSEDG